MVIKKTNIVSAPDVKLTNAGPGQIPTNPQPIPKITEPPINFKVIPAFVGRQSCEFELLDMFWLIGSLSMSPYVSNAVAITTANDGFQSPATSRKPKIFDGSTIPDTASPSPKINPANRVNNCLIIASPLKIHGALQKPPLRLLA